MKVGGGGWKFAEDPLRPSSLFHIADREKIGCGWMNSARADCLLVHSVREWENR